MSAERRKFLNDLLDRLDAFPARSDPLGFVKTLVAETLKFPGASEEERLAVLTEMEAGGYEALLHMLRIQEIPAGFNPNDRPWNRN
jgi:hypothetical protein